MKFLNKITLYTSFVLTCVMATAQDATTIELKSYDLQKKYDLVFSSKDPSIKRVNIAISNSKGERVMAETIRELAFTKRFSLAVLPLDEYTISVSYGKSTRDFFVKTISKEEWMEKQIEITSIDDHAVIRVDTNLLGKISVVVYGPGHELINYADMNTAVEREIKLPISILKSDQIRVEVLRDKKTLKVVDLDFKTENVTDLVETK